MNKINKIMGMLKYVILQKKAGLLLLFAAAFFCGQFAGKLQEKHSLFGEYQSASTKAEDAIFGEMSDDAEGIAVLEQVSDDAEGIAVLEQVSDDAESIAVLEQVSDDVAETVTGMQILENSGAGENWGLSFQEEGKPPVANAPAEELAQYDAFYAGSPNEKKIYLTFDCGYENGNTPAILDALKKHQVSATFFVVGNFVEDEPELIRRMLEEGHTVGNHTMHHPDMSKIADAASFQKEMEELSEVFKTATGREISPFYRPPQGKYNRENLQMAKNLGYRTFFWSLAYVDWYEDKQPSREEAFKKLLGRIHPGAIVLLHNTSATNAAILDELLSRWEEMGYSFGKLEDVNG